MMFEVLINVYLSYCVIFPLYSRNDHSENNFEDIINSSPTNPSVAKSFSHEGYYNDNNGHSDVVNDQEYYDDDEEEEDILYNNAGQEPDHSTPLAVNSNQRDGNSESDFSAELTSPKSR